jgi:hypothetical protein
MAIAQGVDKQIRFKRQSAKGSLAGTTGGQIIRRSTGNFNLTKETYSTADEMTSRRQVLSSRHGVKSADGTISNLLSCGTYSDFLGALLRGEFASVTAITGLSVTVGGTAPNYTLTRSTGSWLSGGVRIGQVVRLTAGTFNANNINKNLLVTAVTATVITCVVLNGSTLTAEGPITSSTVAIQGKVARAVDSAHTNIYYTFEEWHPNVPSSERFLDVKVGSAGLTLPSSGNATTDFSFVGLDMSKATTAYFTSPTAETTTNVLTSASGALYVSGTNIGVVTDLNINIDGGLTPADGVVGSNVRPDVFTGNLTVTGSFTAYFDDNVFADAFANETEVSILSALTDGTSATADFMTVFLPRVKVNSANLDDGQTGLKRTYDFEAIYNATSGASETTTIQIVDSQA